MGNNLLRDLVMAGVKWELNETSTNFDAKKAPIQQTLNMSDADKSNRTNLQPTIIPASAPITLDTVKSMVERPNDPESLVRMICEFNHPLKNCATNVVLPNIPNEPNGLMIITDIPSPDDDLSGRVLSGAAGEMIDKMLGAIEMSRQNVSVLPLIFWRTPGGRTPTREELDLARPFIDKMINMLQPRIIITLGTLATTEIANTNLTSVHGTIIHSDNGYIIVPLFHPNYLILKPSAKRDVWAALQNIQKLLKNQ